MLGVWRTITEFDIDNYETNNFVGIGVVQTITVSLSWLYVKRDNA